MRKIFTLILVIGATASAQTARPTSGPASRPAAATAGNNVAEIDPRAADLLKLGMAELEAGQNAPALSTLTTAQSLYSKVIAPPSSDSAIRTAINHAAAVAHFRSGDTAKAKLAIDRALASKWTNDSLIFNGATIAAMGKTSAVQAVAMLDIHMAKMSKLTEQWVDLYGTALDKALQDKTAAKRLEPRVKSLERYVNALEKNNPGKHRWGTRWVEQDEWNEIQNRKTIAKRRIDMLQRSMNYAAAEVKNAEAAVSRALYEYNTARERDARTSDSGVTRAQQNLAEAQNHLELRAKELEAADRGPQPVWDARLETILPDPVLKAK